MERTRDNTAISKKCDALKSLKEAVLIGQARGAFKLEESAVLLNNVKRIDQYINLHTISTQTQTRPTGM
jgi:hypothetical protein